MKQKLSILILLVLMAALLAGLNAASYVQKEKTPDSEWSPNRSSFNSGATGTQAFYTLLAETGHKVMRWQDSPPAAGLRRYLSLRERCGGSLLNRIPIRSLDGSQREAAL